MIKRLKLWLSPGNIVDIAVCSVHVLKYLKRILIWKVLKLVY